MSEVVPESTRCNPFFGYWGYSRGLLVQLDGGFRFDSRTPVADPLTLQVFLLEERCVHAGSLSWFLSSVL